jgi:hypothetical protein
MGGRLEAGGKILGGWIGWRNPRSEQRSEDEKADDGEADACEEAVAEKFGEMFGGVHERRTRGSMKA